MSAATEIPESMVTAASKTVDASYALQTKPVRSLGGLFVNLLMFSA